MRVGSEATGALQSSGVKNLQTGRALVSSPGSKTPLIREEPLSVIAKSIQLNDPRVIDPLDLAAISSVNDRKH